ncbi:hypothetical protein N24_1882 [Corynebacterium suranareeae]|uniref:Uncharacterized protein n=1 Tax=Corynebacterium suranareeae TaxID=2506452 RepID=A0A160PRB3_9CORY|nr:hypothetical protein [Corynebacterium suranareeae]BAU96144.1 hypothetical protein N24_1882 [Corynebacterium suranareeae]
MANFRSKDKDGNVINPNASTKGVDLVVNVYDSAKHVTEKGNTIHFADVQVAQIPIDADGTRANANLAPQTMPHLHLETKGGQRNTGVAYSDAQIQAMQAVAAQGRNQMTPLLSKDGETVGYSMLVKADVMFPKTKDGKSLPPVMNTKSLQPSGVPISDAMNIQQQQFMAVAMNRQAAEAQKAAQAQATQAQAPQVAPQPVMQNQQPAYAGAPVYADAVAQATAQQAAAAAQVPQAPAGNPFTQPPAVAAALAPQAAQQPVAPQVENEPPF